MDHVWFGTDGGVSVFNGGTDWISFTTTTDGLAHNRVNAIATAGINQLWYGTQRGGVSMLDGAGTWTTFTTADGLAHSEVRAFAVDGAGHKLFGTQIGFSELSPVEGTSYVSLVVRGY
jgi:ligand-binding sensor domain-containing protein